MRPEAPARGFSVAEASASLAGKRAELAKVERHLQKLLDTLLHDGHSVIDAIILTSEDGELSVYLKGNLAGILSLAQNKTMPLAKLRRVLDLSRGKYRWLQGDRKHREHSG